MSETTEILAVTPELVSLCGRPGRLEPLGDTANDAVNGTANESCWVWRTDRGLLQGSLLQGSGRPVGGSLFTLACEVAELYHRRCAVQLSDVPGAALEVMWLELAADNSLLVFLKSAPTAHT